jgi:hypothetical protein
MTLRRLPLLAVGICGLLLAADGPRQKVQMTDTQRIPFPAGGALHLKNSTGELWIEGWDQPDMEITTVKTTPYFYTAAEHDQAAKLLQEIKITAERHDNEILVTTIPVHRNALSPARWLGDPGADLDYRIRVPRSARLTVEHKSGEVHVEDLAGDVRAYVRDGMITIGLPEDAKYAISAQSDLGDVISDFPGHSRRRIWIFAHKFSGGDATGAAHKLDLKVGTGDIMILKHAALPQPGATSVISSSSSAPHLPQTGSPSSAR